MATKEELLERAKELDIDGRSTMNKEELEQAVAAAENSSDSAADQMEPQHEGGRGVAQTEDQDLGSRLSAERVKDEERVQQTAEFEESHDEVAEVENAAKGDDNQPDAEFEVATASHHSAASDAENPAVQENLSPEGQETLEEVGTDSAYATESDLALDASGPLHFESPDKRIMTGAVNEDHAKEQEEILKDLPKDYVGDVTESGKTGLSGDTRGIKKDNLSDNDDRSESEVPYEVRQEHVIDFPAPVEHRKDEPQIASAPPSGAGFGSQTSPVSLQEAQSGRRGFQQKAVFYTDGISGEAEHVQERAYEIPEKLQSNDPRVRAAGDVSVSEAAWEKKSDEDKRRADFVKNRDDDPSQVTRNDQ
jgi:hypothetical protein